MRGCTSAIQATTCVRAQRSVVPCSATPWTAACPAPLSIGSHQAGAPEWIAISLLQGDGVEKHAVLLPHRVNSDATEENEGRLSAYSG